MTFIACEVCAWERFEKIAAASSLAGLGPAVADAYLVGQPAEPMTIVRPDSQPAEAAEARPPEPAPARTADGVSALDAALASFTQGSVSRPNADGPGVLRLGR